MPKKKPAWEKLELIVIEIQKQLAPKAEVRHNHRVIGKSGRTRKLDVTITKKVGIYPVFIVFDCKRHKKPVKGKDVAAFSEQLEDVDAHLGVMISSSGFDSGAKAVASKKNILLQTYRKAKETDWREIFTEAAWATLTQVDVTNVKAYANLVNLPSPAEIPFNSIICNAQGEVLTNLEETLWNNWKQSGHPIGEFSVQLRFEDKPSFVRKGEELFQVHNFIVNVKFVAKKYIVNLHLAEGNVLEDFNAEKPVYRELASKGFDWTEIVKNQPGIEISHEEYQNLLTKSPIVDLKNAQRFLRLKIIAKDESKS